MTLKQESIEIEVILDFKMYCEKELISNMLKTNLQDLLKNVYYRFQILT